MAEDQGQRDNEDLTEEASPHRLEEMRQRGQVSQSRELAGLGAFVAASAVVWALSPKMGVELTDFMREVFRADLMRKLDFSHHDAWSVLLMRSLKIGGGLVAPVALTGALVGALGNFVQVGSIFSFEPVQPDLSRINPLSGLQRFFTMRHFIEGISIIFKSVILLTTIVWIVKGHVIASVPIMADDPASQLTWFAEIGRSIVVPVVFILAGFGGIDFAMNRWEYQKQARLTKQEAKQEFKEREGDPQLKARIRSVQREAARKRMMAAVKKADVIVTNPTHIAVALSYNKDKMAAPRVVAKGADFLAQRIKQIALEAGVPMVENVPLARTLYKTVKVGQGIPRALYQAVAEVLAYVYRLKGRK